MKSIVFQFILWIVALLSCAKAILSGVTKSNALNVVILPGFGNDATDYINPRGAGTEFGFLNALERRGHVVSVVPIPRASWLTVSAGIFVPRVWRNEAEPKDLFSFYMDETEKAVCSAFEASKGEKVTLIGHSAGGWLARAIMGDGLWNGREGAPSSELIHSLITLGSPHFPPINPEADMTRGCLRFVDENFPADHLSDISYTSVAAQTIIADSGSQRGTREQFAHQSYSAVIGEDDVSGIIGDGIVPLSRSHLPGAKQITLPGVYHSIDAPDLYWYGGEKVIDDWLSRCP